MDPCFFDRPVDRTGSDSLKWNKFRGKNVLPFWIADMDFASPPAVIQALKQRADHGVFGYACADPELEELVAERLDRLYGWAIEPRWLVWLPGLVPAINAACRAVGEAADAVVTATPAYPPFLTAPRYAGRRLVTVDMEQDGHTWKLDPRRLEAALGRQAGLFLLCSPHNPTGVVFSQEQLEAMADACLRHDVVICSDEIHCDLILEPGLRHRPTATLSPEVARRTITLMAPSKTYNIAGLGCSFAIIPDDGLRRRFKAAAAGIVPDVTAMGFAAARGAYQDRSGWLEALLVYLRHNRDLVVETVAAMPKLTTTCPQATYLCWIDARATGLTDPAGFFEQAGVGLSDGKDFGAPGFVRLNFGCPRSTLEKGLARMQTALQRAFGDG